MNFISNGDFFEWPNGTSLPVAAGAQTKAISGLLSYVAVGASQPAVTISRQEFGITSSIKEGFPRYFVRVTPTTTPTLGATDYAFLSVDFDQTLERRVDGNYAVLTFWAKATTSRELVIRVIRHFGTGGSGPLGVSSYVYTTRSVQISGTWAKYQVDVRFVQIPGAVYGTDSSVEARIYFQGGTTELGNDNQQWVSGNFDFANLAFQFKTVTEFPVERISSNVPSSITTIYATDPTYGAVGNYSGDMATAGSGTDNRAAIQAALNAARTLGTGGYTSLTTGYSTRVKLPSGKYYIAAPSDGSPSLVVPAKVDFDFSEAELYFSIPPRNYTANGITEPNPAWCGILVGAQAGLQIGRMQIEWATNQTYSGAWYGMTFDAIRVQESDISYIRGASAPHQIFNWRGAGIRYIASWNAYLSDVSFSSCCFGVVMGYFGNAFSSYTRYRGTTDSESVSTSMYISRCSFTNIYRTGIFVGAGHDWYNPAVASTVYGGLETLVSGGGRSQNGGPITVDHCAFENVSLGAIFAYCPTGGLLITDCRMEECDDNSTSLGVVYGNCCTFKVNGLTFGSVGTRNLTRARYTGADQTVACVPNLIFFNDGVNTGALLQNVFVSNFADNGCQLIKGTTSTRMPTLINYKANSASMMQGTDSSVKNIIFPNDGGRIWSVSTVGLTPAEAANGARLAFTFTNGLTPPRPDHIFVDGVRMEATDVAGTNWTWNSVTGVVTFTVAPVKSVRAFF